MGIEGIITIDEKKQQKLYDKEWERIRNIDTWVEAMEEAGRLEYIFTVTPVESRNNKKQWLNLENELFKKMNDKRRKCYIEKNTDICAYSNRFSETINWREYFSCDYEVGKNTPYKKLNDDGAFIKGFLEMAKLFGDKRKEEEITAPFVEVSKGYKEKKQNEEERKERLAESLAEAEKKKEAALDYMNRLTAIAQNIVKTKMFNNTPLNLLSVEEIGYGCGLFALFAETAPQAFIFSEMADAFYALKLYLPSKYKELTIASRFVFLDDPENNDTFIRGFRKGLYETLFSAYSQDYVKADILKELKKIGEKNILSCLYDDDIYNYLHKLGKIH